VARGKGQGAAPLQKKQHVGEIILEVSTEREFSPSISGKLAGLSRTKLYLSAF